MAGIEKPNRYRGQTWQVCPDDIPVRFESLLGTKFKPATMTFTLKVCFRYSPCRPYQVQSYLAGREPGNLSGLARTF